TPGGHRPTRVRRAATGLPPRGDRWLAGAPRAPPGSPRQRADRWRGRSCAPRCSRPQRPPIPRLRGVIRPARAGEGGPRPSQLRRARDDVVDHLGRATSAADVFARASSRLRRVVPFDGAAWLGTDPATGFPTSPVRTDHLADVTPELCASHWEYEHLVDDVN